MEPTVTDPVTDKSDTRGLVGYDQMLRWRAEAIRQSDFGPDHIPSQRVVLLVDHADAALSCVRRLLDGCEPLLDGAGWFWFGGNATDALGDPMSPSEVHIIEMGEANG